MATVSRCLTIFCFLSVLPGCTTLTPSPTHVVLTDQWCQRYFGGTCPKVTYKPPITVRIPSGPLPDINLTAISCDYEPTFDPSQGLVWKYLVTAHVSNNGNAEAVADSNGNSVTVTAVATLQDGSTELVQNEWPGNFFIGDSHTVRLGPMVAAWPRYTHISVRADTTVSFESDYSNNYRRADVQPGGLPDSKSTDTIYCEDPKMGS